MELGPPRLAAEPGAARSTVPAWQAFRERRGQHAGDFTLAVFHQRRPAHGPGFLDLAAAVCLEAAARAGEAVGSRVDRALLERAYWPGVWEPDPNLLVDIPMGPCGALLWATARQGGLTWDWGELSAGAGEDCAPPVAVAGRRGHGPGWVPTRVHVELPWHTRAATLPALRAEAHQRLAALPAPSQGVSRAHFAAAIDEDLDAVARLCGPRGLLASSLVPDAEEPVEQLLVVANDGNTCELCWETATGWHAVLFETS